MDLQTGIPEQLLAAAAEMAPLGLAAPPPEFSNIEIAAGYVPLINAFSGESSGLAMSRRAIHLHIAAVHDETQVVGKLRRELEAFQLLTRAQELVTSPRWTRERLDVWLSQIVRPGLEKVLQQADVESGKIDAELERNPRAFQSDPAAAKTHSRLTSLAGAARLALAAHQAPQVAQLSSL